MIPLKTIAPKELEAIRRGGQKVKLIDIRTPDEFHQAHADIAVNVPLARLDPQELTGSGPRNEPIYVIGQSGLRGRQACERLRAAGCENVVHVEGGTEAWARAGMPIVHDPEPISLRRAWLTLMLILMLLVLVGFHIHPVLALVLALLFADPLLTILGDIQRPRWRGHSPAALT